MADLSTLDGISSARNELYRKLESGEITEARAAAQERILRGQEQLKGSLPLRFILAMSKLKSTRAEPYIEPLAQALLKFTTGDGNALQAGNK